MAKVLIMGATSAIAAATARRLGHRGDDLFLLARDGDKLAALVAELAGDSHPVVGSGVGDFDETEANHARVSAAIDALGGLDLALIAHGWLGDQVACEQSYGATEAVLRTNFLSVISLLIPLANHFAKTGGGHIAVLSSVAGERGRPRNYTYGAAKGALNLYLQGMRSRLHPGGTQIHTIKLGPVHSPMTVNHPKNALFATPDRVAADIIRAIDSGAAEPYVPWYWGPIMAAVRTVPEAIFQKLPFLSGR